MPPLKDIEAGPGKLDLGFNIIARWQVNRELEIMAGYARIFPAAYVANTSGGGRDANWAFAQLTYNF